MANKNTKQKRKLMADAGLAKWQPRKSKKPNVAGKALAKYFAGKN